MLDHDTRVAILRLAHQGHKPGAIAKTLGVSPVSVKKIIQLGTAEVPRIERPSRLDPHIDTIRELYAKVGGNLVVVHEQLALQGIEVPYTTLTDFCRRQQISAGGTPAPLVGQYHFLPGEEAQHDTSPHAIVVGGRRQMLHCAALVLCFSRMIFAQYYETWNRFWVKVFLTEALLYFDGVSNQVMIDNSSVILARGSGRNAVIAPDMQAFGDRYGFVFRAHELGDVNRSARVERTFQYLEKGFYPGDPADLTELNAGVRRFCDRSNERYRRHLRARPVDLFVTERAVMKRLPIHVPEVYELWHRSIDSEGYVHLHRSRYSVPEEARGEVQVRETKDQVRIFQGPRLLAEHERQSPRVSKIVTLPEHRSPRRRAKVGEERRLPEEQVLRAAGWPEMNTFVDALRKQHGGRAARAVRKLHALYLDYAEAPLRAALVEALTYGLLDLERLERIVLRHVGEEIFRLPLGETAAAEDNDDHNSTTEDAEEGPDER